MEQRLKAGAGLETTSELSTAVKEYGALSLKKGASVTERGAFLLDYVKHRTAMIRVGLIDDNDPAKVEREVEDFKRKIAGSDMLRYLTDLPEFPSAIDSLDADEARTTVLGRCRQWINGRRTAERGVRQPEDMKDTNFLKLNLSKSDKKLVEKATKLVAFGNDGARWRAARDTNNPKGGGSGGGQQSVRRQS